MNERSHVQDVSVRVDIGEPAFSKDVLVNDPAQRDESNGATVFGKISEYGNTSLYDLAEDMLSFAQEYHETGGGYAHCTGGAYSMAWCFQA